MKEGKAEYFVAEDIETKEEIHVKIIPPQPEGDDLGGITEEERKKIYKNEEDLGNKITKFYASNQGENHLADSDNGKIQDMMLYGKSEQKQYSGKNLINSDEYYSEYKQSDGTYKGTANNFHDILVPIGKYIGTQITVSCKVTVPQDTSSAWVEATIGGAITKGNIITSGKSGVTAVTIIPKTEGDTIVITYGVGGNGIVVVSEFQIEKGSETTPYEPYTGGQPSPSPDYPQEIKSVVNPTVKITNEDGLKVQSITLNNIILNAISVSSGGNVTINGQQYIADYVDVERGKLVRMCKEKVFDGTEKWRSESSYMIADIPNFNYVDSSSSKYMEYLFCNKYKVLGSIDGNDNIIFARRNGDGVVIKDTLHQSTVDGWKKYLNANPCIVCYLPAIPEEIDLTTEEITAFKSLATYYPTTNISVNSEQLDGYTVFNYPISLANGWNYVKQQLNDNRDYIYDMDTQSAEAYVNSEYAVALTELEV